MGSGDLTPGTPESIIEEAQRRIEHRPPPPPPESQWVRQANRGVWWLAQHWLGLFNILIGLYVGGTFLAPTLMWLGYQNAGTILYRIYMPFCHQYPFRSWFLFGPQAAYPAQQILGAQDMAHLYHQVMGSPTMGYKVALCQRDVAIYGSMVVGGVLFALLRKRFKVPSLPLWAYLVFGVLPMLIDGGWQWLGYAVRWIFALAWWTPHETTPFWRTLTGALFGLGLVALGYPSINEYFEETRDMVAQRYGWGNKRARKQPAG